MKQTSILCAIALACASFITSNAQNKEINYTKHYPLNPPTYVCYKAPGKIHIDGKMSPGEWDAIPWSSDFVDIEGEKRAKPYHQTRAKMTYDNEGMYFAALLDEPHVWGTITKHDAVIFHDNDFEIFINPSNDTHNYLEYEVNALGTVWDLYLTKPYRDQGALPLNNWEFMGMKSAVHVEGSINNPADEDKYWSVEVFIPWQSIYQVASRQKAQPADGDQIRVNFSRVQWTTEVKDGKYVKIPMPGEDKIREHNWVWAPTGVINIHLPEYWGIVQFSDITAGKGTAQYTRKTVDDIKWILRNLYYRQLEYAKAFGSYANSISELKPSELCSPEEVKKLSVYTTPSMYEIIYKAGDKSWRIRQDGLVWQQ